jgi:hypothetical protein
MSSPKPLVNILLLQINTYLDSLSQNFDKNKATTIYNKEKKLIENVKLCTPSGKNSINGISISDINKTNLDDVMSYIYKNKFNYGVMELFRCILNTIVDIEDDDKVSERKRINTYLSNLKRFGSSSANGYVFSSSLTNKIKDSNIPKLIAIKTPRDNESLYEMYHELSVGLLGLNKLRNEGENGEAPIPFFSYVFDIFQCSSPNFDSLGNLTQFCSLDDETPYVIYELVDNSISLNEYISNFNDDDKSISDFLLMIIQLAIGLKYAEDHLGFTHNDLHYENVLCRTISKNDTLLRLPYKDKNIKILSSSFIPTVIDYGMSNINVDGEQLSMPIENITYVQKICLGGEASTITDLHKLILFCLYKSILLDKEVKGKNFNLSNVLIKLLNYFVKDPLSYKDEKIMDKFFDINRFSLTYGYIKKYGYNTGDFIEHLLNVYNEMFSFYPLVDDKDSTKNLVKQYKNKFSITSDIILFDDDNDPFETLNLSKKIKKTDKLPTFISLVESQNNIDEYNKQLKMIEKNLSKVIELQKREILDIDYIHPQYDRISLILPPDDLDDLTKDEYDLYINSISTLLKYNTTIEKLKYIKTGIDNAINEFSDSHLLEKIIELSNTCKLKINSIRSCYSNTSEKVKETFFKLSEYIYELPIDIENYDLVLKESYRTADKIKGNQKLYDLFDNYRSFFVILVNLGIIIN